MANTREQDHWSSEAYQKAASFVPKLATKVVQWLDTQPGDRILDVGCGDGILTQQIARTLDTGYIHGIDSSNAMISTAQHSNKSQKCTFEVLDATHLILKQELHVQKFDKVFSNAALHWILCNPSHREDVFRGVFKALKPGGSFVFEMGGYGNVAEMRAAILAAVGKRIGIVSARKNDPWFFPDEKWIRQMLERSGFAVEKSELEYRPTRCEEGEGGGVEGWVRLMGKQFFDAVGGKESEVREECLREVVETLETVCRSPSGGSYIGYVRLRVSARKVRAD